MPNPTDQELTIAEAARRCGVSTDTIRRRLRADQFPRAAQDGTSTWRIPLGDLVSAGLRPSLADVEEQLGVFAPADVEALREELAEARTALAVAQAHLEAAAAVAAAHEAHIGDLRSEVEHLRSRAGRP